MAAATTTKDINGKKLSAGDLVLMPAPVPGKIVSVNDEGIATVKPKNGGLPGANDKGEFFYGAGTLTKWTPPE